MGNCSVCGHDEFVHFFFVGCCGVQWCRCTGTDGVGSCRNESHGSECWWATPRPLFPDAPPLSKAQADEIWKRHDGGEGTRTISRAMNLRRPLVMEVLREAWWLNPADKEV